MENASYQYHSEKLKELLAALGEDPERDGLLKTPSRVLSSLQFLTSGYKHDVESVLTGALFDVDYQDMVLLETSRFTVCVNTTCCHFMVVVMWDIFRETKLLACQSCPG